MRLLFGFLTGSLRVSTLDREILVGRFPNILVAKVGFPLGVVVLKEVVQEIMDRIHEHSSRS